MTTKKPINDSAIKNVHSLIWISHNTMGNTAVAFNGPNLAGLAVSRQLASALGGVVTGISLLCSFFMLIIKPYDDKTSRQLYSKQPLKYKLPRLNYFICSTS